MSEGKPRTDGSLVLVVGPSGAGKDTLIRHAAEALKHDPRVRLARRIVTRAADPRHEDHDSVDEATFDDLVARGRVALWWRAHGLRYGLPIAIDAWIGEGAVVVANVSRQVVAAAASRYARVVVVHVTAPPAVLRARLSGRGREAGDDIEERLRDVALAVPDGVPLVEIRNAGDLQDAVRELLAVIDGLGGQVPAVSLVRNTR